MFETFVRKTRFARGVTELRKTIMFVEISKKPSMMRYDAFQKKSLRYADTESWDLGGGAPEG
jgi:hypothetical protein